MSPETRLAPGDTILSAAEKISHDAAKMQREAGEITVVTNNSVQYKLRSYIKGYYMGDDGDKTPKPADSDAADDLVNTNITTSEPILTPSNLETLLPISQASAATTRASRDNIEQILTGRDDRLIAVVGPCSVHDPEAALEYADQVKSWRNTFGQALEIVMRVYVEKPRSVTGWKGLVNDPKLNETCEVNTGLVASRMTFCQITHKGVPTATEYLSPWAPQYFNGLISYGAVGARNVEDQNARSYASGVSPAVGVKNATNGDIKPAVDAVQSVNAPHVFMGIGMNGLPQAMRTTGNKLAHVILRGGYRDGRNAANHDEADTAKRLLRARGLLEAIVIDASHGNSDKKAGRQIAAIESVSRQVSAGQPSIKGVMIESNLKAGRQNVVKGHEKELEYGVSITDECVGLEDTEEMLEILAQAVRGRHRMRA